ncbi:unnamed protein product [Fraxinus pennsylvanica]|uniref:Pentatricopeptide repeat-containing protein n=1 Tax=Fraxinus pennsylvanica TaxID=56036 RepID=A0AAD1ZQU4_9LAMI|nr:unnamed protein product [Fraxinus pennsylvanica]
MDRELCSVLSEVLKSEKECLSFQVLDLLEAMVNRIESDGLGSLSRAIRALIKAYVSLFIFVDAIDTLFKIKRHGVDPCLLSCDFLIDKLAKHGKVDMAVALREQMKSLGHDVHTYMAIIKILSDLCMDRELCSALSEVIKSEKECLSFQVLDLLEAMENRIESDGLGSLSRAIRALIKAYVRLFIFEDAIDTLFKIKRHGVDPCSLSCDFLIYKLAKHGWKCASGCLWLWGCDPWFEEKKLKEAEIIFVHINDMEKQGLAPNIFCYSTLIQGYCESGNITKALAFNDEMR